MSSLPASGLIDGLVVGIEIQVRDLTQALDLAAENNTIFEVFYLWHFAWNSHYFSIGAITFSHDNRFSSFTLHLPLTLRDVHRDALRHTLLDCLQQDDRLQSLQAAAIGLGLALTYIHEMAQLKGERGDILNSRRLIGGEGIRPAAFVVVPSIAVYFELRDGHRACSTEERVYVLALWYALHQRQHL